MSQQPPLPPPGSNPYGDPLPPVAQPLWQGQQAPVEGQPAPPPVPPSTRRRRPWLLPTVVAGLLLAALVTVVIAAVLREDDGGGLRVADLRVGDCVLSEAIADGDQSGIDDLERVACQEGRHHGEVFAVLDGADGASSLDATGPRCADELETQGLTLERITAAGLEVRPLATSDEIGPDTRVVCFLRDREGSTLSDIYTNEAED